MDLRSWFRTLAEDYFVGRSTAVVAVFDQQERLAQPQLGLEEGIASLILLGQVAVDEGVAVLQGNVGKPVPSS
jgi:hypothetical protein